MGLDVDISRGVNLRSFMCLIDLERMEGGKKRLCIGWTSQRKLFEPPAGNGSSFTTIRIKQVYQHGSEPLKILKPNIFIFGLSSWY